MLLSHSRTPSCLSRCHDRHVTVTEMPLQLMGLQAYLTPGMSKLSHMHAPLLLPCCYLCADPVRHPAPASPAHSQPRRPAQPAHAAQHLNGRHVSSSSHQPSQPVRQLVPAQQQGQPARQQPSGHVVPPQPVTQQPRQVLNQHTPATRYGPAATQPARKLYSPQVPAHAGSTAHQSAPEADWEAPPEQHHRQPVRKLDKHHVPAPAGSMPHQHAAEEDWEAPPDPPPPPPAVEWEPARHTQGPQIPAHAGSMPHQHALDTDWEAPPEEHHRQPIRLTHGSQVQPHAHGHPAISTGAPPPRRLNGQSVKMPARQQPNGLHEQNGIPAQQFQGETSV